ncbi:hypothetical protein ROLI_009670 [Roseobacter fucihabitans]|uniref:Uncharacterized protein n=1 Tax=Roseobacter fucihabitans TaxID=1537242 RepID=A0ABZ2BPH8_9RHOB|nr:hypothetical protein [Roseobacter litoralis]MBC6966716.1 hypothetical protein [Roseobacter litoralis]
MIETKSETPSGDIRIKQLPTKRNSTRSVNRLAGNVTKQPVKSRVRSRGISFDCAPSGRALGSMLDITRQRDFAGMKTALSRKPGGCVALFDDREKGDLHDQTT